MGQIDLPSPEGRLVTWSDTPRDIGVREQTPDLLGVRDGWGRQQPG